MHHYYSNVSIPKTGHKATALTITRRGGRYGEYLGELFLSPHTSICKREKSALFHKITNSRTSYHIQKNKPTESNLPLISLKVVSPIPLIFLIWLSLKETSRSTVSIPQRNRLLVVLGDKFKASTDK